MTLGEAISYLKEEQMEHAPDEFPEWRTALQIGIEAIKRTVARRERLGWKFEPLLPGETE